MLSRIESIEAYRELFQREMEPGEAVALRRELAIRDLFYLLVFVLRRNDVNHDWIYERCREVEAAPNGYLDVWGREHFKSSLITFGLTIRDILRDPEITVGIFSYSRPIAKAFLRQIKREFENNQRLRELFPDVLWANPQRDAPKWSEDEGIIVRRQGNPKESTVEAWGLVDGQPTSKHFRLLVYDDTVTLDSVSSPEMIKKVTDAWASSRSLTVEGGASRYIGTFWRTNDTYRHILDRKAAILRRHPATRDGTLDGEPVLFSRESLARKLREMGSYVFSAQMLCDPTVDRAQGFKYEWLRFYRPQSDFSRLNKYLLVDPASEKKKTSDYTAMMVVGLGADQNYYVVDMVRDRLNLPQRGDAVFALHRRWKPFGVGYEKYGMMADVEYLKERMDRESYHFNVTELGGQTPKNDRIRRLVPVCEAGRLWLPESLHKVDYEGRVVDLVQAFIEEEYKAFPVASHDDMLDTLARIREEDLKTTWPMAEAAIDRYARRRPGRYHKSSYDPYAYTQDEIRGVEGRTFRRADDYDPYALDRDREGRW